MDTQNKTALRKKQFHKLISVREGEGAGEEGGVESLLYKCITLPQFMRRGGGGGGMFK